MIGIWVGYGFEVERLYRSVDIRTVHVVTTFWSFMRLMSECTCCSYRALQRYSLMDPTARIAQTPIVCWAIPIDATIPAIHHLI